MNRKIIYLAAICMASLGTTPSFASLLAQFDFNDTDGVASGASTVGATAGVMTGNAAYSGSTVAPANGAGSKSLALLSTVNSDNSGFYTDAVFSDLTSFTLAGWIRLTGTGGRIMSTGGGSGGGFDLYLNDGKLQLRVDNAGTTGVGTTAQTVGDWSYFAVTYDGTKTGANVQYYIGDGTTLTANGLTSLNVGVVDNSLSGLTLGNNPSITRNMQGWLDNVRIYGGTGTDGIASVAELTAAMQSNDMIPEPSTLGLVGFSGFALLVIRRRVML